MNMISEKGQKIPDSLLDQISEWSCGGFMLFNFDETGNPQVYTKAEDERNAMAMQYLVRHWSEATENNISDSFMKITNSQGDEDDEGLEENE